MVIIERDRGKRERKKERFSSNYNKLKIGLKNSSKSFGIFII